ncbi:MAG: helix-hairpin-helix domain-containing protein [Fibrobacteres bacterium]|nr:helix-hairpin-helix domain-containing protein [Fibrobacterota bacterium]
MTLVFLAAGGGLKAWRRATVRLGPFPDRTTLAQDSAQAADSLGRASADPPSIADTGGSLDSFHRTAGADSTLATSALPGHVASAFDPVPTASVTDASHPRRKAPLDGPGSSGKIDLNRADAAGLMRIKGVGEKTAEAILAYRRAHGPFRDVRDLLQIKGIGEKKLEKLTPHIIL